MIGGDPMTDNFGSVVHLITVRGILTTLLITGFLSRPAAGQDATAPSMAQGATEQKIEQLTVAVTQAQAQVSAYQKQLLDMQDQITALRQQLAAEKNPATSAAAPQAIASKKDESPAMSTSSLDEIRERQAVEESQIATHEQTKVETESKYPLKVTGLLLFNGFVNTRRVDTAPDPTYALPGSGSTGFSLRQTVLGLDARGPRIFDAASHADVRVDFFADGSDSGYDAGGVLRLRTAHAMLDWAHTEAFVELDRPLISPNTPSSLVATAQPEFAWSGNLWTWNPQLGVSHQITLTESARLKMQAALIDVANSYLPGAPSGTSTVSQTELSRWPGTEARVAFASGRPGTGLEIGVGGYFGPHQTNYNLRFNAWASTVDLRMPVSRHFELTANAYRGQGLGGLGGGGYVDYLYGYSGTTEVARGLDDVGGWTQLKSKIGERIELNGGFGIDNPFASQIRDGLAVEDNLPYRGLVRNRSAFGNVIYSPNAYLSFSLEYRRLWTNLISGPANFNDAIGVGAGYRF